MLGVCFQTFRSDNIAGTTSAIRPWTSGIDSSIPSPQTQGLGFQEMLVLFFSQRRFETTFYGITLMFRPVYRSSSNGDVGQHSQSATRHNGRYRASS